MTHMMELWAGKTTYVSCPQLLLSFRSLCRAASDVDADFGTNSRPDFGTTGADRDFGADAGTSADGNVGANRGKLRGDFLSFVKGERRENLS